jgi:hypothetical protein
MVRNTLEPTHLKAVLEMPKSTPNKDDKQFDDLWRLFELYSNIQIEAHTIYGGRTNLILVSEGLMLLALPAVLDRAWPVLTQMVSALGLWLSLIWLVLEHRNNIHQLGREEAVLLPLQIRLEDLAVKTGRAFQPFWRVGPAWAKQHAKWYQEHSTQTVLRTYMPGTFVLFWIAIFGYATWNVIVQLI